MLISHRSTAILMVLAIGTPVLSCHSCGTLGVLSIWRDAVAETKLDLLQGTLDLMVLQTLETMGALHGYGIARRIEQLSEDQVLLNQGTIYASLVRLQQRGWITAAWGVSDNNRKAKYYSITKAGKRQVKAERSHWQRLAAVMGRVLTASAGGNG